jgi:di/tricarboxylate transporter
MEHYFILGLIVGALALFALEVVRPDIVAIGVALILLLTKTVTIQEGFSGFSNPAVITVIAMFILSSGIVRTGLTDHVVEFLVRIGGRNPIVLTVLVMMTVGTMSAFMNNIGATAILLTAVFAVSRRAEYPASKLLIPLSFGSLLGGLTTLIGTPPNLLVSQALEESGFEGFKMFDFLPTGLAVLGIGVVYMALAGRHLIPVREGDANFTRQYQLQDYITEVVVSDKSSLAGKSILESGLQKDLGLTVLRISRRTDGVMKTILPRPDTTLEAEDRLVVEGDITRLMELRESKQLEIQIEKKFTDAGLTGGGVQLAEVAVAPNASILGQTIKGADIRKRFGVLVLALRRRERAIPARYAHVPLQLGDLMLVQGPPEAITKLAESRDFLVVNRLDHEPRQVEKAPLAGGIMLLMIVAASTGLLHISVAGFLGVVLMVVTGCVKAADMYKRVEWRVIFLIAGMMPLGIAMDANHTGTAAWMADHIVGAAGPHGPLVLMAALFICASLITAVMSNAAAAVLLAPIGISIALGLGLQPHPFLMAVAIGSSSTFLTPVGHQANVLVYGVGGYRFLDFTRVGMPLNVLIFIIAMIVIPLVWPFSPLQPAF